MIAPRKKLIEVSLPLEAINAASKKQKAPKGYPTAIHKYWAQRPISACRGVLFAQLVDDPASWPERFAHDSERIVTERKRLHRLIERLVPWEASNDQGILNEARFEIARSVAWARGEEPPSKADPSAVLVYLQTRAPPVFDPFSGAGSIPLEAQRLGLRAFGSDLNPVAVLVGKALVEIPPMFSGLAPVNPGAQAELSRAGCWNGKGGMGLAEDVRYYGRWMRDEAEKSLAHLYPQAELPDGSQSNVIAWLWARTVRSPDPVAKGRMVPLISSFMVSTKAGRKVWVEPVLDESASDGYRFEIKTGPLSKTEEETRKKGTKSGKGQAFVCLLTGAAIDRDYIQLEGKADRLGQRLMAIVADTKRGRVYLNPTRQHEELALAANSHPLVEEARSGFLSAATPTRALITGGVCSAYGLRTWGHLFTARQLVALTTLADLITTARERALADAERSGLATDNIPLHKGGSGALAYADAIATYLAFVIDRAADYGSCLSTWLPDDNAIRGTFGRQALPMTWDFCEGNYFGDSSASIETILKTICSVVEVCRATTPASVSQIDAPNNNYPVKPCIINTDPPYFDNIGYATLADFFYVWLRRSINSVWPELFRRIVTPKDEELVATPSRHGGKSEAETFFMNGMGRAFTAMRQAAQGDQPLVIYYAFKQSEEVTEGLTSPGWASFLQAIVDAGLSVDGTWPLRTESAGRLVGNQANALASSIVLVCRNRPDDAAIITRGDFVRALKRELPSAIEAIRNAGVGPVDMQQSVIGPGMGIFSSHAKVLEDDDQAMTVKTALALINRVWEEIENELDAAFDSQTQVALAWYTSYGFDARPSGELITLTIAKNTSDHALFASGVFQDMRGKACLTSRDDLPSGWLPGSEKLPTVWECVQHTARALDPKNEKGGAEAAAALVTQMGSLSSDARKLAYRLYEIAAKKGWSAEALVYNELAETWPELEALAADDRSIDSTQHALF